jgi:hypothetical protein
MQNEIYGRSSDFSDFDLVFSLILGPAGDVLPRAGEPLHGGLGFQSRERNWNTSSDSTAA